MGFFPFSAWLLCVSCGPALLLRQASLSPDPKYIPPALPANEASMRVNIRRAQVGEAPTDRSHLRQAPNLSLGAKLSLRGGGGGRACAAFASAPSAASHPSHTLLQPRTRLPTKPHPRSSKYFEREGGRQSGTDHPHPPPLLPFSASPYLPPPPPPAFLNSSRPNPRTLPPLPPPPPLPSLPLASSSWRNSGSVPVRVRRGPSATYLDLLVCLWGIAACAFGDGGGGGDFAAVCYARAGRKRLRPERPDSRDGER